jgi:hypothetical protein
VRQTCAGRDIRHTASRTPVDGLKAGRHHQGFHAPVGTSEYASSHPCRWIRHPHQ